MGKSTQYLQQKVCHKYGWSYHYAKDTSGQWYVEVVAGMNIHNKHRFTSPTDNGSLKCLTRKQKDQFDKAEKEIVSAMAIEGLATQIANEEAKQCSQLSEIFPDPITIYDSAQHRQQGGNNIWNKFWSNPPKVVGIDTEGNQTSPPVLVQISTSEYTILEAPPRNKSLSANLIRLLRDDTITKIFCDNASHADKIALGLHLPTTNNYYTTPPIIDLEVLSNQLFGPTKVARGLAKIVSMSIPSLSHVRIVKPKGTSQRMKNIGRFALIEQGRARPLRGVSDLNGREQQYCALDSWCTLMAYLSIRERMMMEEEESGGMIGGTV